ncbi:hypothetical protein GQX73_g211 [Xylaria multiplex]|uniref:Uncharacterized protein n=1 Tax=Xylaria multiplex TaxID=323545 RepID=A0A7C8N1C6_9PEZI|nr:hypothetical protein GQX73_g211 [Xylaria multiplex]
MTTISTNRGGRHPSNGPDEDHYLAPFPRVELNDSLLDLALSVQRGNWGNLTKLIQSMYGRIPLKSENFPIPSQPRPPRKISANSTPYQAYSIRAKDLTFPNSPPDRTELSLWQNTIAPRITNILLCMAKRSRPSGLEISAYLHMVLGEFLISGQRSPKVAMEKSFGDFLMEGVPRDNEWNDLVMESRPRFLILGKEQNGVAHHWYVIIVDIDTRRAYCFDSKTEQDTRFKHIKAFTFLKKEWAIRLPRIPVPEQMIELPSFTRNDAHSSGFICLYHIILLFRKPAYLRKLRHGDVIATQKHLDRVVRPAERYVGIQIEEPTKEAAPTPELRLGVDGGNHNGPQKKEASMKLKLHIPPKRHRKRPYEKATAAGLSEETKNALPNLSTACKVDDAEPGIDFAATHVQMKIWESIPDGLTSGKDGIGTLLDGVGRRRRSLGMRNRGEAVAILCTRVLAEIVKENHLESFTVGILHGQSVSGELEPVRTARRYVKTTSSSSDRMASSFWVDTAGMSYPPGS